MWSDNIAKKDYLGFEVHANLIKGLVDDPKMLPITIGVFGDWGSGKSTIMEILKNAYEATRKSSILCLQFNGWTFEGYDDAKAALITAILRGFKTNRSLPKKALDTVNKLLKSVNWMRAIGFGIKNVAVPLVAASFTGGVSLGPQILEWMKEYIADPTKMANQIAGMDYDDFKNKYLIKDEIGTKYQIVREFRDDFRQLLQDAGVEKLVVLIDDLDRCLPERIIDNLEAIKLFLNVENTAFIIGADPRIVRDAIRFRYKGLIERDDVEENKRVVIDYLEKLIQVPYTLPKLSDTEVETYITLLFCEDVLDTNLMDKVLQEFQLFKQTDRYSVFGIDKVKEVIQDSTIKKQLEAKVTLISKLSPLISGNLDGNPRQIKRFLNTFILRKKLADVAKMSDFRDDVLAKLMILEYAEPDLFTKVYSWQSQNQGYAIQLKDLEQPDTNNNLSSKGQDGKWNAPKIQTWLRSEPYLANVDLRDYFWLSRDSLESMSTQMTSPRVKQIVTSLMINKQSETLKRKKIKDDVLCLTANMQHELLALLVKRAMNLNETKHILNLFELMIDEGCPCETEFRLLCKNIASNMKPSWKEIINRIAKQHNQYHDLISK